MLIGGSQTNYLYGEHGDDWLDGGAGRDRVDGGPPAILVIRRTSQEADAEALGCRALSTGR